MPATAVVDMGKTHMRLHLFEDAAAAGHIVDRCVTPYIEGEDYPCLDEQAAWAWMRNAFADASAHTAIARVIVTTHGAAAACVVADGSLSAPVMDYEAEIPGPVSVAYEAERPTFAETGSPSLPAGLNLGRQLAWQAALGQLDRARHILTLPQYWAWKLCGVAAGELSALGCHTDLWRQDGEGPSSLAQDRGWARLLPPLAGAGDVLGTVSAEVQASTGLAADCQVHCGVHDSNAALYAMARATQRLRLADPLFISTGTWSIVMAPGRPATALDQTKDTLTNIAVDGRTVPTARFMSGPEYAVLAGTEKGSPPEIDGIQQAIDRRALVTPNLTGDIAGGPFAGRIGRIEPASADDRLRQALAALYIPLMWDKMLTLVAPGERRAPIVVEGPAATPEMTGVLAALRPDAAVYRSEDEISPALGAAFLADATSASRMPALSAIAAVRLDGLDAYKAAWRKAVSLP